MCEVHEDRPPNHDDQRCVGFGVPCPACNDLACPRLAPDCISLASADDLALPKDAVLFSLERDGQLRCCRLVDRGRYGVEARVCDRDDTARFFSQRFGTMALGLEWAAELRAEILTQGWVEAKHDRESCWHDGRRHHAEADRIECPLCEARISRQPCVLCGPGEGSLPRSRLLRFLRLGLRAYNRGPGRQRTISSGSSHRPKLPA